MNPPFNIPPSVASKYPQIVEMLINSTNIENSEKDYWFNSLETMNEEQVSSLQQILEEEKAYHEAELEKQQALAKTALLKTEQEILEQKRQEALANRKLAEQQALVDDANKQDELLSMLDNL